MESSVTDPSNRAYFWLRFVFCVGIINFAVFFIAAIYLGGDAVNGKTVDGHFFLMSHGHYTEVSKATFDTASGMSQAFFLPIQRRC